ncbi:MAG: anti-sigma factor [Chloroflexi bacterium]|nr:MAG: anti-sigma factor [Chloroflexota bacterium]
MDKHIDEVGEAVGAALSAHAAERPPVELRDRILRDVARRGRRAPRWWQQRPILVGAVASGLLLAASLAWGLSLNAALAQERTLRAQLQDAAAKDEVVFEVVDARNVQKTTLRSTVDDSPTAPYAKIFVRPDMPYVVAMVGRLSPPASGRAYHLYLDGRRVGTLAPNDAGFSYFVYRADAVGVSYQQARVVLESESSSDASGQTVLTGSR